MRSVAAERVRTNAQFGEPVASAIVRPRSERDRADEMPLIGFIVGAVAALALWTVLGWGTWILWCM